MSLLIVPLEECQILNTRHSCVALTLVFGIQNIMSTKQQSQAKKMVAPNKGGEEDDNDVGVLIYRESQLMKAEAAVAAESKRKSTSSAPTQSNFNSEKIAC